MRPSLRADSRSSIIAITQVNEVLNHVETLTIQDEDRLKWLTVWNVFCN